MSYLALITRAEFSATYTRTRNGRREIVRKSKNYLHAKTRKGGLMVSARASVPVSKGEAYVLGVGSIKRDGRNIREKFKVSVGKRGVGYVAQGNLGRYQIRARGYGGYIP